MRTNLNQAAFTFWCLVVIILTIVVLRMCAWADTGTRDLAHPEKMEGGVPWLIWE